MPGDVVLGELRLGGGEDAPAACDGEMEMRSVEGEAAPLHSLGMLLALLRLFLVFAFGVSAEGMPTVKGGSCSPRGEALWGTRPRLLVGGDIRPAEGVRRKESR